MKRGYKIFLILLLAFALLFPFVIAQDYPGQDNLPVNVSDIEQTKKAIEEQKWDYLSNEWNKIVLNNPIIAKINEFLGTPVISFIFKLLFAQPYSLSLNLFWIIILWLYLAFGLRSYLNTLEVFDKSINWLISFGNIVILAHLGVLKWFVEWIGWLILSQTALWLRLLIILGIIILVVFEKYIRIYIKAFKLKKTLKSVRKNKKKLEENTETLEKTKDVFRGWKGMKK